MGLTVTVLMDNNYVMLGGTGRDGLGTDWAVV
jgi:hypothetical protein